ncbi:hypothetical protein [Flavobacterium soli]|uniref:hypothetical protein n=1 Tax=Flavobacterium soli TaxID=344881 RepID=UPI00040E644C|nr:hypothetical protein [Flavobacterium soli]
MEKDKIESFEELKEFAKGKFQLLQPNENRRGKLQLSLEVSSYIELQWLIIDIVKVSLAALDASSEEVTEVRNPQSAVRGVLELLLQLLPLEEMQLVDGIYEMLREKQLEK